MCGLERVEAPRDPQPPSRGHIADRTKRVLAVVGVGLATPGVSTGLAIGLHHAYGFGPKACAAIACVPSVLGLLGALAVKIVRLVPEVKREQTISDVARAATRGDHTLPIDSAVQLITALTSAPEVGLRRSPRRRSAAVISQKDD